MPNKIKLRFENISKAFPGVIALDSVSFSVKKGDVHVVVGENGAGKSTLMNIINGSYPATEGKIFLDDKEVTFRSQIEAESKGIGMIHQELAYIPTFTVERYLMLGREPLITKGIINWKKLSREAERLLQVEGLNYDLKQPMGFLSVGQQQLLEITKVMSTNGVQVIIMDEPTSALTQEETNNLFRKIKNLKSRGVTILYISHKLEEIFEIGDTITVLRDGQHIETAPKAMFTYDTLIQKMVGRKISDRYPEKIELNSQKKVLSVNNLTTNTMISEVSFDLYEGEVLGIAGLMGSGRTETLRALFGMDELIDGEIIVNGKSMNFRSNQDAIRQGISLVPEDRRREGIIPNRSIKENISLANLKLISKINVLQKKFEIKTVNNTCSALKVKSPSIENLVSSLSGGNQQKVVLGKWLLTNPKILLLDDPTRGIDVGAKNEIYHLINRLALQGVSIILVSSEISELIGMCKRIYVMYHGTIAGLLEGSKISQENIMTFATGGKING